MGIDCGSQVVLCEYPIRLDTYRGCSHDCKYCFARFKGSIENIKPLHCGEALRRFIEGKRTKNTNWCDWDIPLHWGGMSDPFQPAEREHHATLECLKIFAETGYPFIVSTKGRLIAEEPYLTLLSQCNAVVQVSMTSPQLDKLEKGAPPFEERVEIVRKVSPHVKRVIIRAQPYILECKSALIDALPSLKEAQAYGITLEGMKFKKKKPGLIRCGGDFVYPENRLKADYLQIRERCREEGLAFFCAENRLRSLGDSTACCGCDDLQGFVGNVFNCISIANGSGGGSIAEHAQTRDRNVFHVPASGSGNGCCNTQDEFCRAYDGRGGCRLRPREAMTLSNTGEVLAGIPQVAGRYSRLLAESPFCRAMLDFMK